MNILLAIGILVLDAALFFVPGCAIFIVYILLFKPKWFLRYVKRFYGESI